ncbi:MAG: CC_3452 family protein [Pseudomonadota bacterium]
MFRTVSTTAAVALSLAFLPFSVSAQGPSGYYTATPVTAPAKASLVTRTTVWKCGEGVCAAAKSSSRDAVMCELLAREIGKLSAFTVAGAAFDDEALAKCNAKAR